MTNHVKSLRRTAALVVTLTLFAAAPGSAQSVQTGPTQAEIILSSEAFARQIAGKQLIVTTTDGLDYVGFFTVAGKAMVANGPKLAMTIPFNQVARVKKDSFRMRHHTLIGLGVGAGVGALLIGAACGDDCYAGWWVSFTAISAGIGAGIGAGVGAGLNAQNRERDTIYDWRRSTTTIAFAPIVSPTRKGVAFTMTWR